MNVSPGLHTHLRVLALLAWAAIWGSIPDLDHLIDGAGRTTHLSLTVSLGVLALGAGVYCLTVALLSRYTGLGVLR